MLNHETNGWLDYEMQIVSALQNNCLTLYHKLLYGSNNLLTTTIVVPVQHPISQFWEGI